MSFKRKSEDRKRHRGAFDEEEHDPRDKVEKTDDRKKREHWDPFTEEVPGYSQTGFYTKG